VKGLVYKARNASPLSSGSAAEKKPGFEEKAGLLVRLSFFGERWGVSPPVTLRLVGQNWGKPAG
jgi:hypothetical protein